MDTGLVHRDLKPANIFVRDDGHPVLVDLGIAARFGGARGREELFADTKVMGSALYMAPEQFGGEAFDARADLYSLGCILYETVTGRPPFFEPGITPRGILFRILDSEPEPPSRLATWLDPALERLHPAAARQAPARSRRLRRGRGRGARALLRACRRPRAPGRPGLRLPAGLHRADRGCSGTSGPCSARPSGAGARRCSSAARAASARPVSPWS